MEAPGTGVANFKTDCSDNSYRPLSILSLMCNESLAWEYTRLGSDSMPASPTEQERRDVTQTLARLLRACLLQVLGNIFLPSFFSGDLTFHALRGPCVRVDAFLGGSCAWNLVRHTSRRRHRPRYHDLPASSPPPQRHCGGGGGQRRVAARTRPRMAAAEGKMAFLGARAIWRRLERRGDVLTSGLNRADADADEGRGA